ncbi:hypothetical protein NP233_g6792 [Leucocoprinus birnbaumii]|uniref:Uncharacterized protein n=1 Tax=Leucocoprinus birnbaumii TaxID=56174 RepID=A0AAD5VQG0_9AGAR|nr:hypothetical protein NP233_g6792 [Leucocoprinus birnbaumii]
MILSLWYKQIRINLYASSLIFAILPETPLTVPLIDVCRANASMSGFALLVTAIIRTAEQQLSLYHAIFILHMLFFLGIGLFPVGKHRPSSIRKLWTQLVTLCIAFMFQGWALYIWANAPKFGVGALQPRADPNRSGALPTVEECNESIRYVFVFASVHATALWLRILWIVVLSLEVLAQRMGNAEPNPGRHRFRASQLPLIISYIYAIIMLELYIVRNEGIQNDENGNSPSAWSFGQVINVVMIASSGNEVIHFLLAYASSLFSRSDRDEEKSGHS